MSRYANKGKGLEDLVEYANEQYKSKGIALVQKISTPWNVVRKGKKIVSAYPTGKSTLDFRGTVADGISISFDCKETQVKKGLPLENIQEHQIEYMRTAQQVGEITFLIVNVKPSDYYRVPCEVVLEKWDTWKLNKGKRGFNFIPIGSMQEIIKGKGIALDYLTGLYKQ